MYRRLSSLVKSKDLMQGFAKLVSLTRQFLWFDTWTHSLPWCRELSVLPKLDSAAQHREVCHTDIAKDRDLAAQPVLRIKCFD